MIAIHFKNNLTPFKIIILVFYTSLLQVNSMEAGDWGRAPNISSTSDTSPLLREFKNPSSSSSKDKVKERLTQKSPDQSSSSGRKRSISNPDFSLKQQFENTKRLLSIDGGGIRGLIPAKFVHYLELVVSQALSADGYPYDAYIADYFDVFAGTSTGGIIALGLLIPHDLDPNCPKYKTDVLVDLYQNQGERIFTQMVGQNLKAIVQSKYSPDNLEVELIKKLGLKTSLDVVKDKYFVIPSYNISKHSPKFFSNIKSSGQPYLLWEILRATSAAPTYFPAMRISIRKPAQEEKINYYVDGGVYENNPTAIAVINSCAHFGAKEAYSVLSLGTGKEQKSLNIEKLKKGGKLNWASSIFSVTKRGHEGSILKKMEKLEKCFNLDYNRFDISLQEKIGLDAVDPSSIEKLNNLALEIIKSSEWVKYKTEFIGQINAKKNTLLKKIKSVLINKEDKLDLSGRAISGVFLKELVDVIKSENCPLKELNLSNCRMRGESLEKLCAALAKNKSIRIEELNLADNGIGKDLESISNMLFENKKIHTLNLSGNSFGLFMEDERHQKNMKKLFNPNSNLNLLSSLYLDDNHFQLSGFRKIFKTIRNSYSSNLKVLSLKGNKITLNENEINFKAIDKENSLGHLIIDLSDNSIAYDKSYDYTHFKF